MSTEDKTTREEEGKEKAELQEAEEAIWSRCRVGGRMYKELAVGNIHFFHMETSTFDAIQT
jgi:hypothetical protein